MTLHLKRGACQNHNGTHSPYNNNIQNIVFFFASKVNSDNYRILFRKHKCASHFLEKLQLKIINLHKEDDGYLAHS